MNDDKINNQFEEVNDEKSIIYFDNTNKPENKFGFDVWFKAKGLDIYNAELTPYMKFGYMPWLKHDIYFNFSLLGKNIIVNNIWKYYKEDDYMHIRFDINNYLINKKIKEVKLMAIEMTINDNEKTAELIELYKLPDKKSYNGLHNIIIPFDDKLKKDSLYMIKLEYIMEDENINVVKLNDIHFLYTNGIFNDKYVDRESQDNFDNEYLPLEATIKLGNVNEIKLKSQNELLPNNVFTSQAEPLLSSVIQGRTLYTARGEKQLEVTTSLKKDYNTFQLEVPIDSNTIKIKEPSIEIESQIVNTKNNIDTSYIKEERILFKDEENPELKDEFINIELNDNKLNFDIKLYSPISSDIVNKQVSVDYYFAPIACTVSDFNKYKIGINIEGDAKKGYKMSNQYLMPSMPAIGMSSGGTDNQGGGGLYYVAGHVLFRPFLQKSVGIHCVADSRFAGPGLPGITIFPNEELSNIICKNNKEAGINFVYLNNAGAYRVRINNTDYQYARKADRPKAEDRVKWFEDEENKDGFNPRVLAFLRASNSEDYFPINFGFVLDSKTIDDSENGSLYGEVTSSGTIQNENNSLDPVVRYYPGPVKYRTLLSRLYARRPFTGTVPVHTVGDISYLDRKVKVAYPLEATISYNSENLIFNSQSLHLIIKEYQERFKDQFSIEYKNCFKVNILDGGDYNLLTINQPLIFNFDVINKYFDEYIKYQNNTSIPTYVKSCYFKKEVKPHPEYGEVWSQDYHEVNIKAPSTENIDNSALYVVTTVEENDLFSRRDVGNYKLTKLLDNYPSWPSNICMRAELDNSYKINNSEIAIYDNVNSERDKVDFTNMSLLCYDFRNDTICLNKSQYKTGLMLTWHSHTDEEMSSNLIGNQSLTGGTSIPGIFVKQ